MMHLWFKVIFLFELLNLVPYLSANNIQELKVTGVLETPYKLSGVVTVKFQDVWSYVCYYGSKKRWGKREATTACKQLGYKGGWPTKSNEMETSTHNLHNFDCDESLEHLGDCDFDTTGTCEHSVVAGIQCYNSFHVKLLDGKTPNIGRVQVKYDNVLSDVCYAREGSTSWNFYNTQVLCRELGFPGAMFDKYDSDMYKTEGNTISGYECRDDLREQSLENCNPDFPSNNVDKLVFNGACGGVVAACASPGYVGCFDYVDLTHELKVSIQTFNMTINMCRRHCRHNIYRYAFLQGGDTCSCAIKYIGESVRDDRCALKCVGNGDEICGDVERSSVYDVSLGICDGPETDSVYYYGEYFQCTNEVQFTGQASIQCVLNDDSTGVMWSSNDFPKCESVINHLILPLSITAGVIVLLLCSIIVGVCCYKRSKNHRHHSKVPVKDDDINQTNEGLKLSMGFTCNLV